MFGLDYIDQTFAYILMIKYIDSSF